MNRPRSTFLDRLLACDRGATAVEYLALLGLAAIGSYGIATYGRGVGTATSSEGRHVTEMTGIAGCGTPGCSGPNNCFVAGTVVATPSGPRPIEAIAVGDVVRSRDEATGAFVDRPVSQTFVTPDAPTVDVVLATDGRATDPIHATPGHRFWTVDRRWVEAGRLVPGELVLDDDGDPVEVVSVAPDPSRSTVYNFEVAGTHTYFVGEAAAWVHNPTGDTGCAGSAPIPIPPRPSATGDVFYTPQSSFGSPPEWFPALENQPGTGKKKKKKKPKDDGVITAGPEASQVTVGFAPPKPPPPPPIPSAQYVVSGTASGARPPTDIAWGSKNNDHLALHLGPDATGKPSHSVWNTPDGNLDDARRIIANGWTNAGPGRRQGNRWVYTYTDPSRVVGRGDNGAGRDLHTVTIVVRADGQGKPTNAIVTSYPSAP